MNPFLTFIIILPWIVSLIFIAGSLYGLINSGPRWDIILSIAIFSAIFIILTVVLFRTFTLKGSLIKFSGAEAMDESNRRKITNVVIFVTYCGLLVLVLALLNSASFEYWFGIGGFILGVSLLISGISHLRSASIPANMELDLVPKDRLDRMERALSTYLAKQNYVLAFSILAGIAIIYFYLFMQLDRYVSIVDLLGLLFLLISSCGWFILYGKSMKKKLNGLRQQVTSMK